MSIEREGGVKVATTPVSATQKRVCTLYGLEHNGSYEHAAATLEAAGLPKDGCPAGHNWRSVKQLTDDELRDLLGTASDPGTVEVKKYRRRTWGDEMRAGRARERRNKELKAKGYRWVRVPEEVDIPGIHPLDDEWPTRWALIGPDGKEADPDTV